MNQISQIIIKISERSYNLLRSVAIGGGFVRDSFFKDGFYHISIDKEIYEALIELDSDINKSIFYLVLNHKIKESEKNDKDNRNR